MVLNLINPVLVYVPSLSLSELAFFLQADITFALFVLKNLDFFLFYCSHGTHYVLSPDPQKNAKLKRSKSGSGEC